VGGFEERELSGFRVPMFDELSYPFFTKRMSGMSS